MRELRTPSAVKSQLFARLLLRLLQDDDVTVREYAGEVVTREWSEGLLVSDRRGVEMVLSSAGPTRFEQYRSEFGEFSMALLLPYISLTLHTRSDADLSLLSNPSSLLFAIEKPNIFKDDLLETELLTSTSPDSPETLDSAILALEEALKTFKGGEGPLGMLGNELVSKWAFRLVQKRELVGGEVDDLEKRLRGSYLSRQ